MANRKFILVLAAMAIVILAGFGIVHRYPIPQPVYFDVPDTVTDTFIVDSVKIHHYENYSTKLGIH